MSRCTRRAFLATSAVAGLAPSLIGMSRKHADDPVILGEGEHTYECIHDWLRPPDGLKWGDTHGLCRDSSGRIYVAHTVHPTSARPDAIVVFDSEGNFIESWGGEFRGGAHGLDIREEDGEEFLYHCDIQRRVVVKTTLRGEPVWTRVAPIEAEVYNDGSDFIPTNVAFAPDGGFYIADGYGSSYIHQYANDGSYQRTFGGKGSGEGQFDCPHGLWVDPRGSRSRLVVADRSNRRLQYLSLEGEHLWYIKEDIRRPCHFKTRGELMLVPDLESVVLLLNRNNIVVARLGDGHPTSLRGAAREDFIPGKFIHPHDGIFLANGDILIAEWVPIGRMTLLRKVSA